MRRSEHSLVIIMTAVLCGGMGLSGAGGGKRTVSFKRDILPVFHRYCLPCHTEEQANPSEFFADSYENLMRSAKHGPVVVAGMPDSSHLIQKLGPNPPFGDPMPLKSKKAVPKDTLQLLRQWIKQGARND